MIQIYMCVCMFMHAYVLCIRSVFVTIASNSGSFVTVGNIQLDSMHILDYTVY